MAWKRRISWTIFLALLAALGYAVHLLLPPAPRWELEGPLEIIGLTADSRQFWTVVRMSGAEEVSGHCGPVQLRDLASGKVVKEYVSVGLRLFDFAVSASGQFVIASNQKEGCLYLIDRERDSERLIVLDEVVKDRLSERASYAFTPNEAYLLFSIQGSGRGPNCSRLIEAATGKIKKRFDNGESFQQFLGDSSYALFVGKGDRYSLWNLDKGEYDTERLGKNFYVYGEDPDSTDISQNGRCLLTGSETEAAAWDLNHWQMTKIRDGHRLSFSPTGRFLIDVERILVEVDVGAFEARKLRIAVRDLRSAERLGGFQTEGFAFRDRYRFSKDETMCLIPCTCVSGDVMLELFHLPDGQRLWCKSVASKVLPLSCFFDTDNSVVVVGRNIEVLNSLTGEKKTTIWSADRMSGIFDSHASTLLSKNQRLVWGEAHRSGAAGWWDKSAEAWAPWMIPKVLAFVADTQTGRELLSVPFMYKGSTSSLLSDDNQTLILSQTDQDHRVYTHRAYDVPARPRWAWIVGVPAGLGGLVLGWRRWRKRKRPTVTSAN